MIRLIMLNKEELAEKFGVDVRTVRYWRSIGMPYHKVSYKQCYYEPGEINEWLISKGDERAFYPKYKKLKRDNSLVDFEYVQKKYGVTKWIVYHWIKNGMPHMKVNGRRTIFDTNKIELWFSNEGFRYNRKVGNVSAISTEI